MMSGVFKKRSNSNVECDLAKRGVWLVKVPVYLSECWERNAGQDLGRLVIKPSNGRTDVTFTSNPVFTKAIDNSSSISSPLTRISSLTTKATSMKNKLSFQGIPAEHSFIINDIKCQSLAVLCEDKTGLDEDADICSGRLSIEGRVVKKADCRPPISEGYLRMKINHIERSSQPKKQIKQIEKAEVKFKPIAAHAELIAKERQKKEGTKAVRADKDVVRQMLFHAFEKHQYYRLIDLQKLTNQPPGYVKEILIEIAVYNTMPPHKSMWELKPEYRNYSQKKD
ncbi:unnamed protein product [Dracunculus medinensis]|uniref:General transcription factor IIF subunit 2 n=1 Tax=Dracunculus medinensis TaxID=318479 RepID=A0A0N4UCE2_DRAME|nr:unnamed protein product [Dracunculus medinensis]